MQRSLNSLEKRVNDIKVDLYVGLKSWACVDEGIKRTIFVFEVFKVLKIFAHHQPKLVSCSWSKEAR